MKIRVLIVLYLGSLSVLAACTDNKESTNGSQSDRGTEQPVGTIARWYTQDQVQRGNALYQTHCASCHMPDASGTSDWRKVDAEGKYPPPPLNGTAHTWHHPLPILRRTLRDGGVPLGGSMPGFGEKLSAHEMDDILAWVQSNWPDKIYRLWHERSEQAGKPLQPISRD
jgi:mono/diheme cytochrome c family protein